MALGFKKTKLKEGFHNLHKLIYGFSKSGKTTICSKMSDGKKEPLFIGTEDGYGALEVWLQRVRNWTDFLQTYHYIIKNEKEVQDAHSCIVIDLVSDLDNMCTDWICDKYNVLGLNDMEFGTGWRLQSYEFQNKINGLFNILPLVFITHSEDKELEWEGTKRKCQFPTMAKRALNFVTAKVELTSWIIPAGLSNSKVPMLTFKQDMLSISGTRYKWMTDKNFSLNPDDMKGSYQQIVKHFDDNHPYNKGETK